MSHPMTAKLDMTILAGAKVTRLLSLDLKHFLPCGDGDVVLGVTRMEDILAATTQLTICLRVLADDKFTQLFYKVR